MARIVVALLIGLGWLAPAASARPLDAPVAHASATCADYPNQAAAQRAADTRDADGDGIYCESLPCPCLKPGEGDGGADPAPAPTPAPDPKPSCRRPTGVQSITFSKAKYPHIRAHATAAIRDGWPAVLVINRPGAGARRERVLEDVPTRDGYDRDEYPPAVGRRPRQRPRARESPARLDGRRVLRAERGESQLRLVARRQAAALLRRNEGPLRLPLRRDRRWHRQWA